MTPKCALCQGTTVKRMEGLSSILDLPGNTEARVFACKACGAYFLWPQIPDEKISELYSQSYFTGEMQGDGELQIPASNQDYEEEFVVARLQKFRDTVRLLRRLSPGAKNILDIGAATGDFLAIAKQFALDVAGIELSDYAAAKAKEKYGFSLYQTGIVDFISEDKFDFIHLNHVFEHFNAPHTALARIDHLLAPNGLIYLEVPFQFNIFERAGRLLGKKKRFDVFSLHHPIFYRPHTLRKLFSEHGYRCRFMRCFSWSRYPTVDFDSRIKRIVWLVASLLGQGLMIEAIFERRN